LPQFIDSKNSLLLEQYIYLLFYFDVIVVGGCDYTNTLCNKSAFAKPCIPNCTAIEVSGITCFYAAISLPLALCQSKRETASQPML
jgi:hypothetical protein